MMNALDWKQSKSIINGNEKIVEESELFKIFKEVEKDERKQNINLINFKLIEQTGISLEKLFQKANAFKEKNGEKNYCLVWDGSGISCRNEGVPMSVQRVQKSKC